MMQHNARDTKVDVGYCQVSQIITKLIMWKQNFYVNNQYLIFKTHKYPRILGIEERNKREGLRRV